MNRTKRTLIRVGLFLASGALGLGVAALLVNGFQLSWLGFIAAVVVFTAAQAIFDPLTRTLAERYAPALQGGTGIISTFVALLVATLLSGGLQLHGISTWIIGTIVVWFLSALASWLLPKFLLPDDESASTPTGTSE